MSTETNPWASVDESVFSPAGLTREDVRPDVDGLDYDGIEYSVSGLRIVGRFARITPTKNGAFVAVWRRAADGGTRPFDVADPFDAFTIAVREGTSFGLFVFSKAALVGHGLVSADRSGAVSDDGSGDGDGVRTRTRTRTSVGKRGFRLYAPWVAPSSRQAERSQAQQAPHFLDLTAGPASSADVSRLFAA
ncbi:MepB family protein [Plantibacter sp. YIM 135347]|uniref:MepB family protein n=1 Tax=Plantibacter sp. YIM 135347 TaxID=3423919 RepID=UPI003D328B18